MLVFHKAILIGDILNVVNIVMGPFNNRKKNCNVHVLGLCLVYFSLTKLFYWVIKGLCILGTGYFGNCIRGFLWPKKERVIYM